MNSTLAQLAQQAGITVNAESAKFAELIVKECINGIANDTANYEGVGMMSYYQGVQDAVKSIRKHFGAEE